MGSFGRTLLTWQSTLFLHLLISFSSLAVAQNSSVGLSSPKFQRDSSAIEILNRTATAAGGLRALSEVSDVTESGRLTLFLDRTEAGSVTLHLLGAARFRMEADLPGGKETWIADGSAGSKQGGKQKQQLVASNAGNLGALTFPAAFVRAALVDQRTGVRLMGIEQKSGRPVYRVRIRGQILEGSHPSNLEKDLLIDALTFDVVALNDQPLPMYMNRSKSNEIGPHELDFGDYRPVNGVRFPFVITSSVHGQIMMSITLTGVSTNTNLDAQEFQP